MSELRNFVGRALRRLPVALWWVLAVLAGAVLSIRFERELLPHSPGAVAAARALVVACLVLLPLLGLWGLWRIAASIAHPGWRMLWYVGATAASGLAGMLLLLLLVLLVAWM